MAVRESTTTTPGLRRNAIGLREVLFQSITDMAPGAAIAASIPAGVAFAGGSLPLAVVFALIACLFCACSIGLLAREMPSAAPWPPTPRGACTRPWASWSPGATSWSGS